MRIRSDLARSGALLAAAVALYACAMSNAPAAGEAARPVAARAPDRVTHCFHPRDVWSWRAPDEHTVYLRTTAGHVYRLQLLGPCPDVDWAQRLGVKSPGATMICSAIDASIISPSAIGRRQCPVRSMEELTPAEVAALPPGHRP